MNYFGPMSGISIDISTVGEIPLDFWSRNLVEKFGLVTHDPDSLHAPVIEY